ncbi:MAG: S-methyl-5-thioribose-1-phosphate isomerase [Thaumarchaeota archaeon]|nr:S-methyl-5-thioribose-1-phosphate isomerase [Nitrososphaerota archaeon]
MKSLHRTIADIRKIKIQGANEIAIHSLCFLKQYVKQHGFGKDFEIVAKKLEKVRPTAVVLHNCLEILRKEKKSSTVDKLIRTINSAREKESKYSDKIIRSQSVIMTYCHSGEAMSFIKHSWTRHKKKISVIACLTEPKQQGVLTAKDLSLEGIPVTLIDDNAIGYFIKGVDMVVVGADALRLEGLVNKIGTRLLAIAASSAHKPFYIVANSLKLDTRENFKIEERSSREILRKIINKEKINGIEIRNPAFDITPWELVTAVITERGIISPEKIKKELLYEKN